MHVYTSPLTLSSHIYIKHIIGGVCTGIGSPFSQPRYIATESVYVFARCEPEGSCNGEVSSQSTAPTGSSTNRYCSTGYDGPTCSSCLTRSEDPNEKGYFRLNMECVPCPEYVFSLGSFGVAGVIVLVSTLLLLGLGFLLFRFIQRRLARYLVYYDKELTSMSITLIQSKIYITPY
jgi:hypothetical protein